MQYDRDRTASPWDVTARPHPEPSPWEVAGTESGSARPVLDHPLLERGEPVALSWAHPPEMLALSLKNLRYRLITLGVYNFWGKTEVRYRIWSATRLNGEPLRYNGTGRELFLGFLFILGVIVIPVLLATLAVTIWAGSNSRTTTAFQAFLTAGSYFLIGVGTHRALRYRLSRTVWRGIRAALEGSAVRYAWTYCWTGLVLVLTLGWASPWRATKLQGLLVADMRFGNQPFAFSASSRPLYGAFAVLWFSAVVLGLLLIAGSAVALVSLGLLSPDIGRVFRPGRSPDMATIVLAVLAIYLALLTLLLLFALVSAWYRARVMNHFAAHTTIAGARFKGTATGRSLLWLTVSNLLLVILTLGLLSPVAQARSARYFVQRLAIEGKIDFDDVLQGAAASGRGEGLAQAFDIDAF